MFDLERWQEIFDTIRKNKLRTFLTGLSVASGIFILVILLGFGNGMRNGIQHEFEQDASTSVWIWTGSTSKKYKGLNPGRVIRSRNENFETINKLYGNVIDRSSSRMYIRNAQAVYNNEALVYATQGVFSDFQQIENMKMIKGRFINATDEQNSAKVVVVGNKIAKDIFNGVDTPIGQFIKFSGIPFMVIGVFEEQNDREEERMFVPLPTAQIVFNGADFVNDMSFTLPEAESFEESVKQASSFRLGLKGYMEQAFTIAPDDTRALNVWSAMEEAKRYYGLTNNIKLFFWFVGVCTIIAGVVGVSNIMLIVVKERTREIGIRKALGAKPWAIVGMILHESIFVTAISGFGGLILSMLLLEVVGPHVEIDYVMNPSVNLNVAVATVMVLVLAGTIAGFFPAWRAARIKVIEALRDE